MVPRKQVPATSSRKRPVAVLGATGTVGQRFIQLLVRQNLLLAAQLLLMRRFLAEPVARATWYSAFGVLLYVLGMLLAAFAVRAIVA